MADAAKPTPAAHAPEAARPLPYYAGGGRREAVWRIAPRRCIWLAGAWVAAIVALFLPGCDMSSPGMQPAPTYVAYGLTYMHVYESYDQGRDFVRGNRSDLPEAGGVAMTLACALFPLGSAVFLLTPLLLRRRVRGRFGWGSWTMSSLLLAPWALLLIGSVSGGAENYLYGYYVLAAAHTAAFAVLLWRPGDVRAAPRRPGG